MNKIQKKRLTILSLFVIGLSIAIALILFALKQNINVFLTPSQLAQKHFSTDYHFRLGGMVKKHSVQHTPQSLAVNFIVTDFKHDLAVHYEGVLPDLFREGKGVIAEGYLNAQGIFIASAVLAKHDENYMPKNVYKALRDQS
jgi:cytochrome c-type biogenesis protein CcmE